MVLYLELNIKHLKKPDFLAANSNR